jgi:hypothetical protein
MDDSVDRALEGVSDGAPVDWVALEAQSPMTSIGAACSGCACSDRSSSIERHPRIAALSSGAGITPSRSAAGSDNRGPRGVGTIRIARDGWRRIVRGLSIAPGIRSSSLNSPSKSFTSGDR